MNDQRPWYDLLDLHDRTERLDHVTRPYARIALTGCLLYLKLLPLALILGPLLLALSDTTFRGRTLLLALTVNLAGTMVLGTLSVLQAQHQASTLNHVRAFAAVTFHPAAMMIILTTGVLLSAGELMVSRQNVPDLVLPSLPVLIDILALQHLAGPLMYFLRDTPPRPRRPLGTRVRHSMNALTRPAAPLT